MQVKGGHSASYMNNNMTKSDNYIAVVKNGSVKSRIVIYKIQEIENENLTPE